MNDIVRLEIPISESPIPTALDAFYDFVKTIASPGGGDRLAIFGTITSYDIDEKAVLYNDYVVRAFADRTVRTSPNKSLTATDLGAGDLSERYSERYSDMLRLLVAGLNSSISESASEQIERYETTVWSCPQI